MKLTSPSSDTLPTSDNGATDLQWPPSWWRWLIFALSGTVEIEKQAALQEQRHRQQLIEQQQYNEELRKSNEELRKSNEEQKKAHELRMSELRKENERLAELESKLNEIWHS